MKQIHIISFLFFTLLFSCKQSVNFENKIHNDSEFNIFNYRNFYNGAGVAIGDLNNDNLPDIYFAANLDKNKLFVNKGGFKFKDITQEAGVGGSRAWSTGVVMVDVNYDGYLDIYVCNAGNVKGDDQKNELFINNGDLTFTEEAEKYGLDEDGFTTHAAFFDYDLDGDLDCYILNNSFLPVSGLGYDGRRELRAEDWEVPNFVRGGGDKLLRNDNGKYVDISEEAGIYGSLIGFGLGVNIGDINQDMLPDIYVSNDFYERDYLYINQGDGTFKENIKNSMPHISLASMGADIADINNDGLSDIFVTDMLPEKDERLKKTTMFESYDTYKLKVGRDFYHQFMQNTLQLNNGNNAFTEIASFSGVSATDWSWGALIFDYDNDGYRDIYVCNGIYHDVTDQDFMDFFANDIIQNMVLTGKKEEVETIINKMPSTPIPNYFFKNKGNLKFENYASNWKMDKPSFSNGAAYGDLDNDGDLDLIVNNLNQAPFIYKNTITKNNKYLAIKLKGSKKNTYGIGSIIRLYCDNEILSDQLIPSKGFQSSVDYKMIFGLGTNKYIDSLQIIWPDKKMQILKDVSPNQLLVLKHADANLMLMPKSKTKLEKQFFAKTKNNFDKHKENNHIDFDYEGLITHMLSREGPKIAVGDVNNDNREDLFICGAKGQEGKIYLQKKNGAFIKSIQTQLKRDKNFEDTNAVFFDADGDGDLDIYIVSGGNESTKYNQHLQDRIYLNNGKGTFTKAKNLLPNIYANGSCVKPADFDSDGDIDLFIGSRSVAGVFGISPDSYLLENNGKGKFRDVTGIKAEKLYELGMITDAVWVDINKDNKVDLIVVGEYMSPKIFINNGKNLTLKSTSLDNHHGWWFSVATSDLDKDGNPDLIFGNMGQNTYYKASLNKPMKLYINDFDDNGTIEKIATHVVNGKDKPIHLKSELTSQLTKLKKKNLKFADYAKRSMDELFSKEELQKAQVKQINNQNSCIALNNGNGEFIIKELPKEVQLSNINTILATDIDKDGHIDLILGGNFYHFKPQFRRFDASYGEVLLGDGQGNFKPLSSKKSGIFMRGEVRDMSLIETAKGKLLVAVKNNQKPTTFLYKD